MSPGATFERVYLAIKEELASGRFRPGEHLEPAQLSDELNSSITPVRDALHRLVGEGLVQAPRNDGFRAPLLTEAALRDLYRWNLQLLLTACRESSRSPPAAGRDEPPGAPDGEERTASATRLFQRIAGLAPNGEHRRAAEAANERLRAVRIAEAALELGEAGELSAIAHGLHRHDLPTLRSLLTRYHRTRERSVSRLLEYLQPAR